MMGAVPVLLAGQAAPRPAPTTASVTAGAFIVALAPALIQL